LTTSHRLALNTLYSAVGEGSNLLLFFLGFLAARWLGPVGFGAYSAAFAYVGLFRILPDFGMSYASTLDISRDRSLAARLVGNLLGFQAVLSVVTLALCLGLGRALFEGDTWTAVAVLSVDLVLKSVKSTLRWLLKALEAFGTEAASLLIERVALLGLGIAALRLDGGVAAFVLVFVAVRLVDTVGLMAWVHRRFVRLAPRREPEVWSELLRKGLPFAYAGLMITLFFQVDAVLLEKMRGSREVGWYSAPVRVLEGLTLIPRILGYALIPTMAALYQTAPERVTELYTRGSKYLLVAALPIGAFGLLASDPFIPFLFGRDYEASVAAARWLIPSAGFMFLSNFGETTLACVGRWSTIVGVSTAALIINVILNLLWIPDAGYLGAARATLATEAAYFVMGAVALHLYGHRAPWLALSWRPLAATAVFAAVLWGARGPAGTLAASLLASAAFAAATLVMGVWDPRERQLMRDLWARAARGPA
jgi:O-antigen/teichoic acid export membrane protein